MTAMNACTIAATGTTTPHIVAMVPLVVPVCAKRWDRHDYSGRTGTTQAALNEGTTRMPLYHQGCFLDVRVGGVRQAKHIINSIETAVERHNQISDQPNPTPEKKKKKTAKKKCFSFTPL